MANSDGYASSESVGMRTVEDTRTATRRISSEILDIINLKGEVSKPGPRISRVPSDSEITYRVIHPWSITGPSEEDLGKAMKRLREELPKRDWKIKTYGRNNSKARSLELTADEDKRKFGLNVVFSEEKDGEKNPALLLVNVVSAVYEVPVGKVEGY